MQKKLKWGLVILGAVLQLWPWVWNHLGSFIIVNGIDMDGGTSYLSNAYLLLNHGKVRFADHPGTPAHAVYSLLLAPVKIFAYSWSQKTFSELIAIYWDQLWVYLRVVTSIIFGIGMLFFLDAVYLVSGSLVGVFIAWLMLASYSFFPHIGTYISAEAVGFFLFGLCIFYLVEFFKYHKKTIFFWLFFLSGLLLADRYTTIFITISFNLFPLMIDNLVWKQRFSIIIKAIMCTFAGFLLGMIPMFHLLGASFKWVWLLAVNPGYYGTGGSWFDIYQESIKIIFLNDPLNCLLTFISPILIGIVFMFFKFEDSFIKLKFKILAFFLMNVSIGNLIFMKYSYSRYHFFNFAVMVLILVACFAEIFRKIQPKIRLIFQRFFIGLLISLVFFNFKKYYSDIYQNYASKQSLEDFIVSHLSHKGVIWEWGISRDFSQLWTAMREDRSFKKSLLALRPNLYLFEPYPELVMTGNGNKPVFDVCWDHLYVQDRSIDLFLSRYKDRAFKVYSIPGTRMKMVESHHCL